MAVIPAIDLTAAQRRTVLALLIRCLPNTTITSLLGKQHSDEQ